jgi:MFS family permease
MLLNPQILLLCGIYFSVQLSIYANTFWLPTIVKQIPGTTDLSVGFLSSIPWVCAVFAMYFAAKWQDKAKSKRPLLVAALLVAAVGTLAAAVASPVLALVFLAIAAMGFKSASPLFWTIPQSTLHPLVLAPAIAIINSLGNLGGFVAPFGFGIIKEQTGSVVFPWPVRPGGSIDGGSHSGVLPQGAETSLRRCGEGIGARHTTDGAVNSEVGRPSLQSVS